MNIHSYKSRIQDRINNASEIDKAAKLLEEEETQLMKNLEATI